MPVVISVLGLLRASTPNRGLNNKKPLVAALFPGGPLGELRGGTGLGPSEMLRGFVGDVGHPSACGSITLISASIFTWPLLGW